MVFILFNIAQTYKYISKYGIFHLMSKKTASFTQSEDSKMFGELFLLDIMYDFSKDNYISKKFIFIKALEIRNFEIFNRRIKNKRNENFLKNILKKIIKCDYIDENDKNILKSKFYNFI